MEPVFLTGLLARVSSPIPYSPPVHHVHPTGSGFPEHHLVKLHNCLETLNGSFWPGLKALLGQIHIHKQLLLQPSPIINPPQQSPLFGQMKSAQRPLRIPGYSGPPCLFPGCSSVLLCHLLKSSPSFSPWLCLLFSASYAAAHLSNVCQAPEDGDSCTLQCKAECEMHTLLLG